MKRIFDFIPKTVQEEKDKELMVELIQGYPEAILNRSLLFAHLSASAMVFNQNRDKVLMIYHNIYKNWTMTGGHADGEKDLLKVAINEVREETGVQKLKILSEDILSLEVLPVEGHYKNGVYVASHLHLNVTFALEANEAETLAVCEAENSGVAWLPIDRLAEYSNELIMIDVFDKCVKRVKLMKL